MIATLSEEAKEDLRKLQFDISKRIISKIKFYITQSDPISYANKLNGDLNDCFRFRIGDYRAIFSIRENKNDEEIYIIKIMHRKDIYR